MDRRAFLSSSLAASAVSIAKASEAIAQVGSASATASPEYYDLRRYQLVSGPGTKLTDDYFSGALVPALNRMGIGPVGAFSVYFGPETPAYYLLMPSAKLETLVTAELELAKDAAFMKAAAPFWDAPAGIVVTPLVIVMHPHDTNSEADVIRPPHRTCLVSLRYMMRKRSRMRRWKRGRQMRS